MGFDKYGMNTEKFISTWKITRQRGSVLYIFKCVALILIASLVGKELGNYMNNRSLLNVFSIYDYIGVFFICIIGIFIGLFLWNHNEKLYDELTEEMNINKKL